MMKGVFLFLLLLPSIAFSQKQGHIEHLTDSLKRIYPVDSTDRSLFILFDAFFNETMQPDASNLSQKTQSKLHSLVVSPKTKNRHILSLYIAYQHHITESLTTGKTNPKFQVALMENLSSEVKQLYGKLPVLIYVYLAEAYSSDRRVTDAARIVDEGRVLYPDAVPLKVYQYLSTKDDYLKQELLRNHPNHWMIKAFQLN